MQKSRATTTRRARRALLVLAAALGANGCSEPPAGTPLKDQRVQHNETVWADEQMAQEYELTLVALWDALLALEPGDQRSQTVAIFSGLDFDDIAVGTPRQLAELSHGIGVHEFAEPHAKLTRTEWTALLEELAAARYRLVQSEFHHARFTPPTETDPARSAVSIALDLIDEENDRRIHVDGSVRVTWSSRRDERGDPIPAKIDATGLRMLTRTGPPVFERILSFAPTQRGRPAGIHPLLVQDLNGDGLSEVVMVNCARVLRNEGGGEFRNEGLVAHRYAFTEAGLVADMNGDANPDFMSTRLRGDIALYLGDAHGRFFGEPRAIPVPGDPLKEPSVLTAGDIDADGDLDLWVAQYKIPYAEGQFPNPFYDANDGYPAHLLLNDGEGSFSAATEEAGLAAKRFRRTYTSSFVDLDEDDDLDLLVVSDFSGIDIYHNDGRGRFVDGNGSLRADRHLFGMSAAFGDYNLDGRLDFFVAGMASTTARRLEALKLTREDRPDIQKMRMRMAFGNRMYLASDGGWLEPEFRNQVARTGWTWGTTAFDFDNDGDPDIFAANGHQSGSSTRDYCTNFWCHDIFDANSDPNPELAELFDEAQADFRDGKQSWDGYQKNNLLMNRRGEGFINVAFLLGVADQFDTRSAVSDDLDADGLVDLAIVEDHGVKGQKLHIYRNRLETDNNWIGVRLIEEGGGRSPIGASVTVITADQKHVGRIVTGETLMGQHSNTLHFGLGRSKTVESIEVRWIDGRTRTLRDPAINRYHPIYASGEDDASRRAGAAAMGADRS